MTTSNDNKNQPDNMELLKKEASACGPECGCHAGGYSGRTRMIVGAIVLIAAGVLIARAVIKNNSASNVKAASEFASLPAIEKTPTVGAVPATSAPRQPARNATPSVAGGAEGPSGRLPGYAVTKEASAVPATVAVQEISSLSELNAVAADTGGVFVFLAGKNDPVIKAPLAQMRSAAKTIEAQARMKIGLFTLKTDSPDYMQVTAQIPAPSVLAMIKGRGMVPVSGEITETKLIQAFVAASSAGGCGPASAGCGPAGCN